MEKVKSGKVDECRWNVGQVLERLELVEDE